MDWQTAAGVQGPQPRPSAPKRLRTRRIHAASSPISISTPAFVRAGTRAHTHTHTRHCPMTHKGSVSVTRVTASGRAAGKGYALHVPAWSRKEQTDVGNLEAMDDHGLHDCPPRLLVSHDHGGRRDHGSRTINRQASTYSPAEHFAWRSAVSKRHLPPRERHRRLTA
jgi:hypothetical protein